MNGRLSLLAALFLSAWLALPTVSCLGCDAGPATITNLPAMSGSGYQVFGLNATGQLTGFFYVVGDHPNHAFLYSDNQLSDLGVLGGRTSEGHFINQSGQIVGKATLADNVNTHAFLFSGNSLQDLGTLGGPSSSATAINDSGMIMGTSDLPAGAGSTGFVYVNGSMTGLGDFGGNYNNPLALNNAGVIVGEAGVPSGDVHAYCWSNGVLTDLGTLGGTYSAAFAVNDSGLIVGESWVDAANTTHAFVVSNGVMVDLGTFGGTYSSASQVNAKGQVIGVSNTSGDAETHGFLYDAGVITDLGTFGGPGMLPNSINSQGQVVGEALTAAWDERAFLWQNGTLVDLNSLLPTNSGWQLVTALYINDAGRIVGVGNLDGLSQWFVMDLGKSGGSPTAIAGPDQTVDCQAQVTLDGSGSTGANNNTLTFEWSVAGNVLGTTPVLTVSLPLGTNVVTLKVTDSCGASSSANVNVIVADTTPPTGSCPGPVSVSADGNCQAVLPDFTSKVVASDNCTPAQSLRITQSPPAGTVLGLGQHPITLTVTDASGNSSGCTLLFSVVDTTPPTILSVPPSFTLSAGDGCQAMVPNILSNIVASDSCTPANQLTKAQAPAAGTLVGMGDQLIVVTVTDGAGNTASAKIPFKVVDTTAPSILSFPSPVKLSADAHCQAVVPNLLTGVLATDNCTPASQIVLVQTPAAGTVLSHGAYIVAITATDAAGNSSSVSVPIEIDDTTPPTFQSLSASPSVLGPPNHQLVPVTISATVTDNCDAAPATKIVSITCNQPTLSGDIQITGNMSAQLAAYKGPSGGARVYTIKLQSVDASGNIATACVAVTVPGKTPSGGLGIRPTSIPVSVEKPASRGERSEPEDTDLPFHGRER